MTELNFKGKEFVYNHHLSVPFRPLVPHLDKGIGSVALDSNLIIHGDNLHALKALLPTYAGKVDCIFIDPPYNTGNEGWSYNDNVNAPMIKEWLSSNPVTIEDNLRHDKWCAMMWPRLQLLYELLAEDGSFWMTIDDNEFHRARAILDEVFGEYCFVSTIAWQARYSVSSDASISNSHNYIIVYSKAPETWRYLRNQILRSDKQAKQYSNPDNDPLGPWRSIPWDAPEERDESLSYPITTPRGTIKLPPKGRHWSGTEDRWQEIVVQGLEYFGQNQDGAPAFKRYLKDAGTVVPVTWWPHESSGQTDEASKELTTFNLDVPFKTPKPVRLLKKIFDIATRPNSIILDSFAGSATTAHAVLKANKQDGGNRRFILVEMEDYADRLTAERVRRVINGYKFSGTQRTELLREKVTWTKLKKCMRLIEEVEKVENLHRHEYDTIKKSVKNGELIVTGENVVAEQAEGLGGVFTYCTLGNPVELDKLLNGESLPSWASLGAMLFNMATNCALDSSKVREADSYLGEADGQHVWLIYKPDLRWLKSPEAALTLERAAEIAGSAPNSRHLVIAAARYVSQKMLGEQNIPVEFVPLPFALYRIDRD